MLPEEKVRYAWAGPAGGQRGSDFPPWNGSDHHHPWWKILDPPLDMN